MARRLPRSRSGRCQTRTFSPVVKSMLQDTRSLASRTEQRLASPRPSPSTRPVSALPELRRPFWRRGGGGDLRSDAASPPLPPAPATDNLQVMQEDALKAKSGGPRRRSPTVDRVDRPTKVDRLVRPTRRGPLRGRPVRAARCVGPRIPQSPPRPRRPDCAQCAPGLLAPVVLHTPILLWFSPTLPTQLQLFRICPLHRRTNASMLGARREHEPDASHTASSSQQLATRSPHPRPTPADGFRPVAGPTPPFVL